MKKYLVLLLLFLGLFVLAGCKKDTYTIALITDLGNIDDQSFNQGAWEGIKAYVDGVKEDKPTYKYYQPAEGTDDAYLASIDLAVQNGAKVVVTPGYLFETAVNLGQTKYPDVKFIILDASPTGAENGTIEDNTYSIFYAEEQAGYLAGYAIVKDGYTNLGFMGGVAVPAVVRFGHGFVIGADAAAQELEVEITIQYQYAETFNASPDVKTKAETMYNSGVEVIFACGGSIGQSVMAAAGTTKKVIGVDVDQSGNNENVITSATKELGASVKDALTLYFNNEWEKIGGKSVILDAAQGGVGLPMDTSRFATFTKADYDVVFKKLVDGDIVIDDKADTKDVANVVVSTFTTVTKK